MRLGKKNGKNGGVPASAPSRGRKPVASISLDLDNMWSYLKIHGDAGWTSFPSYLDELSEIVLDKLRAHGLTVTVFVVGQDAALPKNQRAIRAIADAGHEIGNHSFSHEPWFQRYSYGEVEREIADAEEAIERATGQRPRGFRGPGFSLSPDTLRVLAGRRYLYDASTFPTFLGPVARAYYFLGSRGLSKGDREKRKELFGTAREGLRDLKPYFWALPAPPSDGAIEPVSAPAADAHATNGEAAVAHQLLEIPVTTMPLLRVPIHMSYVVYLAVHSPSFARAYLRTALSFVRKAGVPLSFLLHPLDFMGKDKVDRLDFFPGMQATTAFKLRLFDDVVGLIKDSFEPMTMREHAKVLLDGGCLKTKSLS